jgi:osmotically-inducible protein OsmY
MADKNRNRQDAYRQQNDWNDNYGRQQRDSDEEPNYTISENRGHRDSGRHTEMSSGDGGWQSRYERQMNTNREGDYDNGNYQRQYGRQNIEHNRGGNLNRGISSAYSDFGGDYSSGSARNLYDRGHQGMGRKDFENRENRLGGSNYDRYGDRDRYDQESHYSGGHEGASFMGGRPEYGRSDWRQRDQGSTGYGDRSRGRDDSDERSWWDRTSDKVSSWFGDEDAERRREQDRNMSGQYRGKGPKNYSRSDDRIKDDINDRLSDDPFVDASDIDVTVSNGEVTLTGNVDHRSTKRRAEDLAEDVSGVKNVENRLRVSQLTGSQTSGVSGMNSPSGSSGSISSSAVPGSERSRATSKEGSSYVNK